MGAFVCSAAVLDAVEEVAACGDTVPRLPCKCSPASARPALPLEADEWWFDVDTPTDRRRGSRFLFRSTGKALDGAVATRLNRAVSQRFVTPVLLGVFPTITPNQITIAAFAVVRRRGGPGRPRPGGSRGLRHGGKRPRWQRRRDRPPSAPLVALRFVLRPVLDRAADGLLFTGAAIYLATSGTSPAILGRRRCRS